MTGAFDPTTPNIARVYDYLLGGKDNFPPDRDEGDRLLKICPFLRDLVRENRDHRAGRLANRVAGVPAHAWAS